MDEEEGASAEVEGAEAKEDREDQMRMAVVGDMFGSDWKLDRLVKTKLSQVKLPAKIFCRNHEGKIVRYEGPNFDEDPTTPDIEVLVRNPWPGALITSLPSTTPSSTSFETFKEAQREKREKGLIGRGMALDTRLGSMCCCYDE